jgi:hypothetical protein
MPRVRGRHSLAQVLGGDALNKCTFFQIARHNRKMAAQVLLCRFLHVEVKYRRPVGLIGAMTREAIFGQNRPNIPVELNHLRQRGTGSALRNVLRRSVRCQ